MIGQREARAAVLSRLNPPDSMPWARIPKGKNSSGFSAHISPYHTYNIFQRVVIDNIYHHQHHKVCDDLIRKSQQQPLWFSVSTSKANGGNSRVVRSLIQ